MYGPEQSLSYVLTEFGTWTNVDWSRLVFQDALTIPLPGHFVFKDTKYTYFINVEMSSGLAHEVPDRLPFNKGDTHEEKQIFHSSRCDDLRSQLVLNILCGTAHPSVDGWKTVKRSQPTNHPDEGQWIAFCVVASLYSLLLVARERDIVYWEKC